jgi:hypothetical protein
MDELVDAYVTVIADIAQDIGWEPKAKERVLNSLKGRLNELLTVWNQPADDSTIFDIEEEN